MLTGRSSCTPRPWGDAAVGRARGGGEGERGASLRVHLHLMLGELARLLVPVPPARAEHRGQPLLLRQRRADRAARLAVLLAAAAPLSQLTVEGLDLVGGSGPLDEEHVEQPVVLRLREVGHLGAAQRRGVAHASARGPWARADTAHWARKRSGSLKRCATIEARRAISSSCRSWALIRLLLGVGSAADSIRCLICTALGALSPPARASRWPQSARLTRPDGCGARALACRLPRRTKGLAASLVARMVPGRVRNRRSGRGFQKKLGAPSTTHFVVNRDF